MLKLMLTVLVVAISSCYGCSPCNPIPTGYNGQPVANLSIAETPTSTTGQLYANFSDNYVSSAITPYNILFTNYSAALVDLENLVPGSLDNVDQLLYEIDILINTVVVGLELEIGLASSLSPDAVCKIRQNLINVLNLQLNTRISLVNSLEIAYENATEANDTALAEQLCDRLFAASLELEDELNESINETLLFVNCTTNPSTRRTYYNYLDSLFANLENLLFARIRTAYNDARVNCTIGCSTTELVTLTNHLLDVIERQIQLFQTAPAGVRRDVSRRLVRLLNSLRHKIENLICCLEKALKNATGADRQAILNVIQQLQDLLNRIDLDRSAAKDLNITL